MGLAAVSIIGATTYPPDRSQAAVTCTIKWALPTVGKVELFANMVLFVPLVLLVGVASRGPVRAAALGNTFSAMIQLTQALVPTVGRACDTNDWLCNTIGSVLGAALASAALMLERRWSPTRSRSMPM